MRKLIIITILIFSYATVSAQGIFAQQKKRLILFGQQIVLLNTMYGSLKKGYKIVQDGLDLSQLLKGGEFSLHQDHISSLSKVNPAISGSGKVKGILSFDKALLESINAYMANQAKTTGYPIDLIAGFKLAAGGMILDAETDEKMLQSLLTPGELAMTDQERITQIDLLYKNASGRYSISQGLISATHKLYLGRSGKENNQEKLRELHGLNAQ
jgi:hypothetical protein